VPLKRKGGTSHGIENKPASASIRHPPEFWDTHLDIH
jgi:hypothetical protein